MFEKCEAIVIRTSDYGETNKIVTLFTREWGKVAAMARGAKKPNSRLAAITQPFTYGYYLMQKGSGLATLQQGEVVKSMRHMREDLFATAYVTYIAELLDRGTEEKQRNPYLFELFLQTMTYIDEGYDCDVLTNIFEIKMLPVFGFQPQFHHCASCGVTEGAFSFSVREGGLLCHQCVVHDAYAMPLLAGTARLLKLFSIFDLSRLGQISVKPETKRQLQLVIKMYYDEYTGLTLKSRKFLEQMHKLRDQLS